MKRNLSSLIILILIAVSACFAADAQFPVYSGYLNDEAKVIDPEYAVKIKALLNKVEENTGVEMAVLTVKSTYPLDTKSYAVQLFEKWGIGKREKDNGLLLLLMANKKERRVEVEVGYGLEGMLPDGFVGAVLDKYAIPEYKGGNYGKGTYLALLVFSEKIVNEFGSKPQTKLEQINLNIYSVGLALSVIILVFIVSMLGGTPLGAFVSGAVGAVIGYFVAGMFGIFIGLIAGMIFSYGGYFGGWGGGPGNWGAGGFGSSGPGGGFGGFGGGRSGGGGTGRSF